MEKYNVEKPAFQKSNIFFFVTDLRDICFQIDIHIAAVLLLMSKGQIGTVYCFVTLIALKKVYLKFFALGTKEASSTHSWL